MSNGNGQKADSRITLFGKPIKDWAILVGMLAASFGGYYTIGGTPNQTTTAIKAETDTLSYFLERMVTSIEYNTRMGQINAVRLGELESSHKRSLEKIDSLQAQTMEGFKNLDGYFRGRLDQIK